MLYRPALALYHLALRGAARLGHPAAGRWVAGRAAEGPLPVALTDRPAGQQLCWVHCASLGEWEQGRPVIEAFRRTRPDWQVLLTFFSPSGYDRRRDEPLADYVRYLPLDGPRRSADWVAQIRPELALFVKYEFWHYYLAALARAGTPTFLVAGSFRPGQPFFRPWGGFWRRLLGRFTGLVVQTEQDRRLLVEQGGVSPERISVGGDPRADRVLALAAAPFHDERLAAFTAGAPPTLLAGSVWPEDVAVLRAAWPALAAHYRLVLAPHQLHEAELSRWTAAFGAVRYTQTDAEAVARAQVLVLDTIGVLSRAYRYARVAYVGGAFRTGLHNTLEPMAYGLPVLFGPQYDKFPEATAAVTAGGAVAVTDAEELQRQATTLLDPAAYARAAAAQRQLAEANRGAAERTLAAILNKS